MRMKMWEQIKAALTARQKPAPPAPARTLPASQRRVPQMRVSALIRQRQALRAEMEAMGIPADDPERRRYRERKADLGSELNRLQSVLQRGMELRAGVVAVLDDLPADKALAIRKALLRWDLASVRAALLKVEIPPDAVLGRLYAFDLLWEDAIHHFRRALDARFNDATAKAAVHALIRERHHAAAVDLAQARVEAARASGAPLRDVLDDLADTARRCGDGSVAESAHMELHETEHSLASDPWYAWRAMRRAEALTDLSRIDAAAQVWRDLLAAEPPDSYPRHARTALALLLKGQGTVDEAESLLRLVLEEVEATLGIDNVVYANTAHELGTILCDTGREDEAVPLFARAEAVLFPRGGLNHPRIADMRRRLGRG